MGHWTEFLEWYPSVQLPGWELVNNKSQGTKEILFFIMKSSMFHWLLGFVLATIRKRVVTPLIWTAWYQILFASYDTACDVGKYNLKSGPYVELIFTGCHETQNKLSSTKQRSTRTIQHYFYHCMWRYLNLTQGAWTQQIQDHYHGEWGVFSTEIWEVIWNQGLVQLFQVELI